MIEEEFETPPGISNIEVTPSESLRKFGSIIDVEIKNPSEVLDAFKHPNTIKNTRCKALIDTGSAITVVSDKVAKHLKTRTGLTYVSTAEGSSAEPRYNYSAVVKFRCGIEYKIAVVNCPISHRGYDCIIGRDIMENWVFTFNGLNGLSKIQTNSVPKKSEI
jgi:aspartyl protease